MQTKHSFQELNSNFNGVQKGSLRVRDLVDAEQSRKFKRAMVRGSSKYHGGTTKKEPGVVPPPEVRPEPSWNLGSRVIMEESDQTNSSLCFRKWQEYIRKIHCKSTFDEVILSMQKDVKAMRDDLNTKCAAGIVQLPTILGIQEARQPP